jgi:hypothetical protein
MNYEDAMAHINRRESRIVGRESAPRMHISWRFGRTVMLMRVPRFVDYTPTDDDMRADDWRVLQ